MTKDAVWYRKAVLPDKSGCVPPLRELAEMAARSGQPLPETFTFPNPRMTREEQQDKRWRDLEVDPHVYYPKDLCREPGPHWPKDYTINVAEILGTTQQAKK